MSYANGTTHYNLPQTVGTDKRDWADTNQAFSDVDAALYTAATTASTTASGLSTLDNQVNGVGGIDDRLTTAENDIDNVEGDVSTLQSTVGSHTTQIADVRQDCEDMITAHNEAAAESAAHYDIGDEFIYNDVLYRATAEINIGDTIVPNTNCAATNVMTEVNAINTALSDKASTASVTAINDDLYSAGVALISADISSTQDLTPSQAFTNFNTIKVRIGAYYSAQDRNLYMQAFDIDLRHLVGSGDEFIYSWYQTTTNFMTVEFGIVSGKLQINAIQLGTDTAQNFAVYVEAYGYKQTL